ncbi:MAG: ABC transporter ATP-binding protein [Phycisphaerae bacterium]|nr:ABC transporter ATP-binding protein [Phycisphaerae bacterium]
MEAERASYIWQFLRLFKPYKGLLILVLVIAIGNQAMVLAFPWLARWIVNEVVSGKSGLPMAERIGILKVAGGLMFAMAFGIGIASFARGNLLGKLLWEIIFELRQSLSWHLKKLSLSFYNRQQTGHLVSRLINDINQSSALVSQGAINLFLDMGFIVAAVVILWQINPRLTMLTLVVLPVYFVAFRKLNPQIREASRDVQSLMARMSGNVQERLYGISLIQTSMTEKREQELFTADNQEYTRKVLHRRNLNLLLRSVTVTVNQLGTGIIVVAGGYLALRGSMNSGDIVAFVLYIAQVYGPLGRLAEINIHIQQALGSLERIFDILQTTPEIKNSPEAVREVPGEGRLTFDDVRFAYGESAEVLRGIDLDVSPGTKVAVVGPSGAGKSTLVSLIPRLYDVSGGAIRIDGTDIREIHLKTLRRMIGIVQQEPFLFSISIRDNIAYSRPDATMEQIEEAARSANAHEFISRLPEGYETMLSERGGNLSVGQRQRICLARTMLEGPRILILDEATSSLDSESENLIQQAMERVMEGRTSVIIAHRLSTITSADLVVVLADGRIAEAGSHSELWERGGLYARLLDQQFGPLKTLLDKSQRGMGSGQERSRL